MEASGIVASPGRVIIGWVVEGLTDRLIVIDHRD